MLAKHKKEILYLTFVFLLLCCASAYQQIGRWLTPTDALRPVIVYSLYVILLAIWCVVIHSRVTQRNMRIYLTAENILMLFGMTIRFIQEAFRLRFSGEALTNNYMLLMRFSGYCTNIAFILIPLFGLYASFGLAKTEEYRFNRMWHTLLMPAVSLVIIVLTNDAHHFTYRLVFDETRSTLYYIPAIGFYIIICWTFALLFLRIHMIYRRSRPLNWFTSVTPRASNAESPSHRKFNSAGLAMFIPLFFTIMIALAIIPYIAASFVVEYELLEQEVTLFFLEILVWESCILVGLVPVNTHYDEVFDRSTIAMQIVNKDGEPYLRSLGAPVLTHEMFNTLKERKTVRTPGGIDLHMRPIHGGYLVWQNDVSQTLAVIEELKNSMDELEQDAVLIQQELAVQSDEVAIKEQNAIYNRLIDDVGGQIILLRNLLEQSGIVIDKDTLFKHICLIGAYIKRRCHLRLVEQSDGNILNAELQLCFLEIINYLREIDIDAEVVWHTSNNLSPEFSIFILDVFESILEYELFDIHAILLEFFADTAVSMHVRFNDDMPRHIPVGELQRINKNNHNLEWQTINNGYRVDIAN